MQAQGPTVPRTFIAFAPYGVGVLCALFYFEKVRDLYGWWIGARDSEYHSAYFKLEEYFATKPTRFYATQGCNLYGGWPLDYGTYINARGLPRRSATSQTHSGTRLRGLHGFAFLLASGQTRNARKLCGHHAD